MTGWVEWIAFVFLVGILCFTILAAFYLGFQAGGGRNLIPESRQINVIDTDEFLYRNPTDSGSVTTPPAWANSGGAGVSEWQSE